MPVTPVSLLEQLQRPDDPGAWERFVRLYTPLLLHWTRRLGLQEADGADLVQEVLAVLVRKLPGFRYDEQGSFRAWLRTVTLNKWRDWRERRRPLQWDEGRDPPSRDGHEAVELFEETEYRRHLVGRALELMRPDFQPGTWKAFWEHGVVGRPAVEVAAELGVGAGVVYSAKFRVLDRLRKELRGLTE
jgi:RNA polymerase sigma-70 factor (ECF subfamily)